MKTLTDYERGFLEALIDGEGCISFGKHRNVKCARGYTWQISCRISNTNRALLEKAKEMVGEGTIRTYSPHRRGTILGKKNYHLYTIRANACRWLFPQLRLIVKEENRLKCIESLSLLRQGGHTPIENVRKLNVLWS